MKIFFTFLFLGLVWSGSFVAIKISVQEVPPFVAAFGRVVLAALTLALIAKSRRLSLRLPPKTLRNAWITGLFTMGIAFSFLFFAEMSISAGLAAIINGTVPLWSVLLGKTIFRQDETLNRSRFFGLLLGFSGIYAAFYNKVDIHQDLKNWIPLICINLMAICYGIGSNLGKGLMKSAPPHTSKIVLVFHQCLSSAVYLLILSLMFEPTSFLSVTHWEHPLRNFFCIAYMGVFSTAIALILFFDLIEKIGVFRGSSVAYLLPAFGILLDKLVLNSHAETHEIVGMLLILTGVLLVQGVLKPLNK